MKQLTASALEESRKNRKLRQQFTGLYFFIVFPFFFVFLTIFYVLQKYNILQSRQQNTFFFSIALALLCILLAFCAAYFLMVMIFRPMEKLNEASLQIAKGDYSVRLHYDGKIEEIENTVNNFNFMVQELNSVEMMRNDFIGNISHEFKTPLAAITGYATLLQDGELSQEERQAYIQKMFLSVEKLNDLTENILTLSRLENQSTLPAPVKFRLDEQIREAIVVLEPKWSEKDTVFNIDLEELYYTGQKTLLFHVWQNVIGNAIKFTGHEGRVDVSLFRKNDGLFVRISDNGMGMDGQTQAHIFEKFYQGDTSHRSQGNGLGLAMCKEILNRCGGMITVDSKLGEGAVFTIQLAEQGEAENT
ncbi:MAG: HAMP domain-containing sensor histidine kinase [Eubacteriales bacterium]|nr:HAMP domain-containing sensor histidine kinase [Eubacteriales bacterium]